MGLLQGRKQRQIISLAQVTSSAATRRPSRQAALWTAKNREKLGSFSLANQTAAIQLSLGVAQNAEGTVSALLRVLSQGRVAPVGPGEAEEGRVEEQHAGRLRRTVHAAGFLGRVREEVLHDAAE